MMRSLIAAAALALLAACGNHNTTTTAPSEAASGPVIPAEWVGKITANPTVAANYASTDFKAQGHATAVASGNGVQVTTERALGAFSVLVDLGQAATGPTPKAIRVTVQATKGALQLVMTHRNFAANFQPFTMNIDAGEAQTVYLPVDTADLPVLIVANASRNGASEGTVTDMQLLTPPG